MQCTRPAGTHAHADIFRTNALQRHKRCAVNTDVRGLCCIVSLTDVRFGPSVSPHDTVEGVLNAATALLAPTGLRGVPPSRLIWTVDGAAAAWAREIHGVTVKVVVFPGRGARLTLASQAAARNVHCTSTTFIFRANFRISVWGRLQSPKRRSAGLTPAVPPAWCPRHSG